MDSAYSYTVLRYVHDIATGEFVNVGVVLCAPSVSFAGALCCANLERAARLFPDLDCDALMHIVKQVANRVNEAGTELAKRSEESGSMAKPDSVMTLAHSILLPDDSSLQWSPPGGGLTNDPSATLEQLYARLVTRYDGTSTPSCND